MEAWRHGGMEVWRHGGMEAWRYGHQEVERGTGTQHTELKVQKYRGGGTVQGTNNYSYPLTTL